MEFEAPGAIINPFEVEFKRDERVLRFLTTRMDRHHVDYAEKRKVKIKSNSKSSTEA
jgi:small subunit ribosomal protein S6